MNQITIKIYELNMQNTKQLLIQQNNVLNKNTKIEINNLVLRDYYNKNHEHEIIATNVTYLLRTWDAKQNHLYL